MLIEFKYSLVYSRLQIIKKMKWYTLNITIDSLIHLYFINLIKRLSMNGSLDLVFLDESTN